MPDPRPLPSLHSGGYDNPPASSDSVSNRRSRIRRMLRHLGSEDTMNAESLDTSLSDAPLSEGAARRPAARSSLRRRRSISPLDAEFEKLEEAANDNRRRFKRRRLEQSPSAQITRPPIKYGYYGQVEAGRLKMELVSCDGGEHKDPRSPDDLGPQNILRHDKSVYCSERSCVNIVMRHADDTAFCLEKLHIVAPENGFTSPVREGVIYIAMTMSELLEHIHAPTPPPRINISPPESDGTTHPARIAPNRSIRSSPERLTLADALRDPEIDAALTDRNYARGADGLHDLSAEEDLYAADFGPSQLDPAWCYPTHSDSPAADFDNESRGRPTALLSDEEPGPEDTSPPGWSEYRLQRLRNMRRRAEMENWDRDERWGGLNRLPPEAGARNGRERSMWNLSRLDALMARSRVRDDDGEEDLVTPLSPVSPGPAYYRGHSRYTADPTRPARSSNEEERSTTNVRKVHFHIKKSKHKVAIKFSPAVSGRFVLLKLWSGQCNGKGNVDVQTVMLKGFSGGRFFPAVDMT